MTTELNEPKQEIRIDVVQRQYKNNMTIAQLARLYEVEESVLVPLVEGITPKKRDKEIEDKPIEEYTREELEEILIDNPTPSNFKRMTGIYYDEKMHRILDEHGLLHLLKTDKQIKHERFEQIVRHLDEGMDRKEICQKLGISKFVIYSAIKHLGRDDLMQSARKGLTDLEREVLAAKILERVQDKTVKEILSELGINRSTYDSIRREYKLPSAKRPPKNQQWNEKPFGKGRQVVAKRTRKTDYDYEKLARQIEKLRAEGLTNSAIIKELGICNATYYKVKELYGQEWPATKRGRKKEQSKQPTEKPKEEPSVKETTTASLESAVTAFRPEEAPEVIPAPYEHKKPSTRVINRDKDVWAEYLTARSQEIHDVAHDVEVVVEDGKLIERTTIAYTLERELTK